MNLEEALHRIADFVPWHEESTKLEVHAAITDHFAPTPDNVTAIKGDLDDE